METIFDSKKLELSYQSVGEKKGRKQNLSNISEDAPTENLANFSKLMGQLAPEEEALKTVMVIEKHQLDI